MIIGVVVAVGIGLVVGVVVMKKKNSADARAADSPTCKAGVPGEATGKTDGFGFGSSGAAASGEGYLEADAAKLCRRTRTTTCLCWVCRPALQCEYLLWIRVLPPRDGLTLTAHIPEYNRVGQ